MSNLVSTEVIATKIFVIRGKRVMLDADLAVLYGVETKVLIQSVKRNIRRFPEDFMFRITKEEFVNLRSQFVTSNRGGRRYLPYVFTQEGVAMLSSVLNSERAIMVNIQIMMRAFAQFRRLLLTHKDLRRKIEEMEKKYDAQFKVVFEALKKLLEYVFGAGELKAFLGKAHRVKAEGFMGVGLIDKAGDDGMGVDFNYFQAPVIMQLFPEMRSSLDQKEGVAEFKEHSIELRYGNFT